MKKILYTMLVALAATFSLTSCEDVPAPYDMPTGGGDTPGTTEIAEGDGSLESPYNALGVTEYINTLEADVNSDNYVYIKGIVSSTKEISAQYGNASFYISADGTTSGTQFYVYRVKGLGNKNIASDDEIKVGDNVIVCAKVVNYKGGTPETVQGEGYVYSLNGKTEGGSTDTPSTPTEGGMGITEVIGGKTSSADLPENAYGSQKVADESTWYTWKYNNVSYTGARICKSSEANGKGGIQIQGGTEEAKQGFIFNSSAFGSDIKTVTLYVRGKNTYDTPTTFAFFEGTAAHPTANKLEGKVEGPVADGDFNTFTITFTFTAGNRFFTIWNNAQGALYIDKIAVELN